MSESKRIAIVDDNADIRYMVSEICHMQGWEPLPCADHHEVRALLESGGPIDLFVVDYHLPEVDGVAIVRIIRQQLPRTPVIVLTVEEKASVLERFMDAGASDYALKPIRALDLLSRIKVHLSHREQTQHVFNDRKGIGPVVLQSIVDYLKKQGDYVDIVEIAEGTQISSRSAYRYLRHMQDNNMLDVNYDYSTKLGRPKAYYRLREQAQGQ